MQNIVEKIYALYLTSGKVSTDTRHIASGSVFFALKGDNFNGNRFVSEARDKGAVAAVIDEATYAIDGFTILADDVLSMLQQVATFHRQQLTIPVIAITGSNGKTTTKELAHAVLSAAFNTFATRGNLNNHIGVPLSLLSINRDYEMAIIEMGANHQKEIAALCDIAYPSHGMITNIGKAHLEGFGGIQGVKKGKGEMYTHLRSHQRTVFINADDTILAEMLGSYENNIPYGTSSGHTVTGTVVEIKQSNTLTIEWTASGLANTYTAATQLTGNYNLPNLLAAICIGIHFGVPADKINSAISAYQPDNHRSQITMGHSNALVVDCYNANPTSMASAIESFSRLPGDNKVYILGDMMELGDEAREEHQKIVKIMGAIGANRVIFVGSQFREALDNASFSVFDTAEELSALLANQPITHSTVLIKGSRKLKLEQLLEQLATG